MQRGYGHPHGKLTAYIFSKDQAGGSNYNKQDAARSRPVKGNFKIIKVKGQGHFNCIGQKGTFSTIYDLTVYN